MNTKTRMIVAVVLTLGLFFTFVFTNSIGDQTRATVQISEEHTLTVDCGQYGTGDPRFTSHVIIRDFVTVQDAAHYADYRPVMIVNNNCAVPIKVWYDAPDYDTQIVMAYGYVQTRHTSVSDVSLYTD